MRLGPYIAVPPGRLITVGSGLLIAGGSSADLTADRTITIDTTVIATRSYVDSGDAASVAHTVSAGTGLSGGGAISTNPTISLANTAVSAGSYTYSSITVDAQGRLTSASSGTAPTTYTGSAGVALVSSDFRFDLTYAAAWTAAHTWTINGIGTAQTPGISLINSTASTGSVVTQYSPMQVYTGTVWNSTSSASAVVEVAIQNIAPGNVSTTSPTFGFIYRRGGSGSWTTLATLAAEGGGGAPGLLALNAVGVTMSGQSYPYTGASGGINASDFINSNIWAPSSAGGSSVNNFVMMQLNPTINGSVNTGGTATVFAIASKTNTLTGGTIYLADIGTTSSTYFSGYTSKWRLALDGTVLMTAKLTGLTQGTATGEALAAQRAVNGTAGRITGGGALTGDLTLDLATTAVTATSYTNTNLTVDAYGRITAASNGSGASYTASLGVSLVGSDFRLDQTFAPTWTATHIFSAAAAIQLSNAAPIIASTGSDTTLTLKGNRSAGSTTFDLTLASTNARTAGGILAMGGTYSPSTTTNTREQYFTPTFSPSANAPTFTAIQINPTINGTSTGTATIFAIASVTNTLTGGTINLADFGTTTSTYESGFTSAWGLTSGSVVTHTKNAIGVTAGTIGYQLKNTTAATSGTSTQQWSPSFVWSGQGFNSSNKTYDWAIQVQPVSGSDAARMNFSRRANGGSWTTPFYLDNGYVTTSLKFWSTSAGAANDPAVQFGGQFCGLYTSNGTTNISITSGGSIQTMSIDHTLGSFITQDASTWSGSLWKFTGTANTTNLTANTEVIDVNFNLARIVKFATGSTIGTQRAVVFQAPTYAFAGASTLALAITKDVSGAPLVGTNATITHSVATRNGSATYSYTGVSTQNVSDYYSSSSWTPGTGGGSNVNSYVMMHLNPTINGTVNTNGVATVLAIASKTNTLTSGTIYLFDCGTTTTDYITGYTSVLSLKTTVLTFGDAINMAFNATTGTKIGTATSQKIGLWNVTPVIQPTGHALINNVTSGGTNDQTDTWTDMTLYVNDAAAIRNAIYQLSRTVKRIEDNGRLLGAWA